MLINQQSTVANVFKNQVGHLAIAMSESHPGHNVFLHNRHFHKEEVLHWRVSLRLHVFAIRSLKGRDPMVYALQCSKYTPRIPPKLKAIDPVVFSEIHTLADAD